jgi:glycosyltransferase involved in cell wall biosynthesis
MPPDTPTRIVFVEGNVDGTIGGSYFSLLFLLEGLDRARFEPIVVFHREHALLDRFRKAAADVKVMEWHRPFHFAVLKTARAKQLPLLFAPLRAVQSVINFGRFLQTALENMRLLMDVRPALLHLNNSVTRGHEWILAARLTGTPTVVHERGINDEISWMSRLFAGGHAAVICISEAARVNLERHRISVGRLWVIENGLDPARVIARRTPEEVRRTLGIAPHRRLIAVIGNIKRWKGQDVMVRALPAIAARVPDVLCLLVGAASDADMYYKRRVDGFIAELGMEAHVLYTGYTPNVADYLGAVEIAVHTSVTPEPFGRVLLEAMAMHKPVVGSRDGAVPEIVVDGETGYTVEPNNPAELADRILRLLEDPERARAFGDAGRRRLEARFHVSRNVEKTMALYEHLLGRAPDGAPRRWLSLIRRPPTGHRP